MCLPCFPTFQTSEKYRRLPGRALRFGSIAAVALSGVGCSSLLVEQSLPKPEPSIVVAQKGALHREVWKTVYENYYDPQLKGIDWVQIGRETNEQLAGADDVQSVYEVLKSMVSRLHDRHTYILSPTDAAELQQSGFVGVGLTTSRHSGMEDVDIILRVAKDSPAAVAGVEPGWLLLNGRDVMERAMVLGQQETFRFLDQQEQLQEVRLVAKTIPRSVDERECRWLEGEILYLRFDDFDKGIAEWVEQSLKQSVQAKGLIVDLRWNPGGLKNELDQMLELFLPENSDIGIVVTRKTDRLHEYTAARYTTPAVNFPMVVLVSPYSASCSEILASVIQYHKRGLIMGTGKTAGEVLFSPGWQLPSGGLLKIAAREYLAPSGKRLQGNGVEPDLRTAPRSLFEFRRGVDPAVDAAVMELHSQAAP